jgi:DNA-binding Lrp family transcriptional regulator
MAGHLDQIDRDIVTALVADGRLSVNQLAAQVGVGRSTAYQRLERLQADGVILGFTAVVDQAALGRPVAALILCNLEQTSWREALVELRNVPGVEHLMFTSGTFDAALLVRVADTAALRDVVLEQLQGSPHVRSTQTVFVLDEALGADALS